MSILVHVGNVKDQLRHDEWLRHFRERYQELAPNESQIAALVCFQNGAHYCEPGLRVTARHFFDAALELADLVFYLQVAGELTHGIEVDPGVK